MNDKKNQPILDILYTKKQANKLSSQIDEFVANLYSSEKNLQRIQSVFSYEFAESLLDSLKNKKIPLSNVDKLKKYLEEIQKEINNISVIDLTIAISPTHQQIKKISNWIANNSSEKYFLNILVDPKIIGGIQVGIDGFFKDKSLRKRLSDLPLSK